MIGTFQHEIELLPAVQDYLRGERHLVIDGQLVPARDGATLDCVDPATGEVIARVAAAGRADVDAAVDAARRAFRPDSPWRRLTPPQRARLLWRLADLIDENTEQLAQLESLDQGKPLSISRSADIPGSAETFRYMAGWVTKLEGRTIPIGIPDTAVAYTRREPVGVVGAIVPWNFPLAMAAWKVAPALAAGCTVVLKPAEQTPLTALRLGELALEAGIPPGVLNVVPGFGATAGAALAEHPHVDKIAFTGSTAVGRQIVHAAEGNLKRVSLELGGKSPCIVMADADLDRAVAAMSRGAFANAGQVCTSGSRLYVHSDLYADVEAALIETAGAIRVGAGLATDSEMGPLVSSDQRDRVENYLTVGQQEGGRIVVGGSRPSDRGYFLEPTIFAETRPDMRIVREEIFGPVATLTTFGDEDELVRQANDSVYGLAAEVWTRDVSTAHRLAARIESGTVWVNGRSMDIALPFGGYKHSGWGREKGEEGIEPYTQTKTVVVQI